MNNVDVVYTLWANLRKTPGMDVGQVGFHNEKEVRFSMSMTQEHGIMKFCLWEATPL